MKSTIYKIVSGTLFPVIFVALFFVIGGAEHGAVCWIGFASLLISYIMLHAVFLLVPKSKSAYLFRATGGTVAGIFFAFQFVICVFFMILDFGKWKIALAAEIILFAIEIFMLLQILLTDEATAKKETERQHGVEQVKK